MITTVIAVSKERPGGSADPPATSART
jgi:hypothetical protein